MFVETASTVGNDLGESLFYDHIANRLRWIDAWKAVVYALDPGTGLTTATDLLAALDGRPIGSIARSVSGGLIAGVRGGFYHLDLDRSAASIVALCEQDRPATNRLNDGKCDRAGRFWCASVNVDHRTPSGALWRLEAGGPLTLMEDGLVCGNGLSWSPDDRVMYLADSFTRKVWRYDFDLTTGATANREVFIDGADMAGVFDGATVDRDGCYWTALFGDGAVAQFDPAGHLMRRIELPVSNPTICAFGGPDLDVLFVASARRFLDASRLHAQPEAGNLFAIHGLGARGLPDPGFAAQGPLQPIRALN